MAFIAFRMGMLLTFRVSEVTYVSLEAIMDPPCRGVAGVFVDPKPDGPHGVGDPRRHGPWPCNDVDMVHVSDAE